MIVKLRLLIYSIRINSLQIFSLHEPVFIKWTLENHIDHQTWQTALSTEQSRARFKHAIQSRKPQQVIEQQQQQQQTHWAHKPRIELYRKGIYRIEGLTRVYATFLRIGRDKPATLHDRAKELSAGYIAKSAYVCVYVCIHLWNYAKSQEGC